VSLEQLTSADAVRAAVAEFDDMGRNAFLERYGFGPSRSYFLKVGDRLYDLQGDRRRSAWTPESRARPLHADQFSGGIVTVAAKLGSLGFEVVTEGQSDPALHLWSSGRPASALTASKGPRRLSARTVQRGGACIAPSLDR
jgi:hypothetical protein